MDVLAGEVVGIFAHVERADEHGAVRLEPLDQRGVARGRGAGPVDLGAGERGQARDIEQVLDRERHADERPEPAAARARRVDRLGLGERARLEHGGERVEHAVELSDARERGADHRGGAGAAVGDGRGKLAGVCPLHRSRPRP